jgi:hypothetical protein
MKNYIQNPEPKDNRRQHREEIKISDQTGCAGFNF